MRRHGFLTLMVVLVLACGSQPSESPTASSATTSAAPSTPPIAASTAPVSQGADAAALLAVGEAQAGQSLGNGDPDRDAMTDAMDLRTVLGADADHILAVALAAEAAAAAKAAPLGSISGPSGQAEPGGRIINAMAILADLKYLPPLGDARRQLIVRLSDIGDLGDNHVHEDTGTQSATSTDGGASATTDMRTETDVTYNGSDVRAVVDRDVHDVVTDSKSGYTLLDHHIHFLVYAELDACPSAKGDVKASSGHHYTAEANTFPASGGAVGSHSTSTITSDSTFQGQVDDQANLTNVAQDAKVDGTFHRTASAADGPESSHEGTFTTSVGNINDGVPVAHDDWAIKGNIDWSHNNGIHTDKTGDATTNQVGDAAGSAAIDWGLIDGPFLEAQNLWRDTRCVIVTVPTWIPLSAYANNARPTHTEEVGKSTSTEFEVANGHRFDQKVTALIKATLDGKESLDPREVPKPPGTLTYVAPDEDGPTTIVDLISTSRQGIGRQRILFHISDEKLKVSIKGSMTTSGFGVSYTTTVSVSGLELTKQSDGTFLGSGPVTTKIRLNGDIPCPAPFTEKGGTLTLRATHPPPTNPSMPVPWTIKFDNNSKFTISGNCLGISLGDMLGLGPNGATGGFMFVLGNTQVPDEGGTAVVKTTVAVGPSQNAIDATVKAEVIKDVLR
jgi:hypothetical protein